MGNSSARTQNKKQFNIIDSCIRSLCPSPLPSLHQFCLFLPSPLCSSNTISSFNYPPTKKTEHIRRIAANLGPGTRSQWLLRLAVPIESQRAGCDKRRRAPGDFLTERIGRMISQQRRGPHSPPQRGRLFGKHRSHHTAFSAPD